MLWWMWLMIAWLVISLLATRVSSPKTHKQEQKKRRSSLPVVPPTPMIPPKKISDMTVAEFYKEMKYQQDMQERRDDLGSWGSIGSF